MLIEVSKNVLAILFDIQEPASSEDKSHPTHSQQQAAAAAKRTSRKRPSSASSGSSSDQTNSSSSGEEGEGDANAAAGGGASRKAMMSFSRRDLEGELEGQLGLDMLGGGSSRINY